MNSNSISPARALSNFRPLSTHFAGLTRYFVCYLVIILTLLCSGSPTQATQTAQASLGGTQSQLASTTTVATLSTTALTTPGRLVVTNNNQQNPTSQPPAAAAIQQPQQPQPKSLKFTLIAGKFWKFNIKTSGFSQNEGELRLHQNISVNNYIINDDSWFQYNPQQQQLFAWPSLQTKPGTYYFVLLPSGLDFEADSENVVNPEVTANIVVELIRPLITNPNSDIDHLIDYKFSLDYLHRHTAYPLLLQQIISILDGLATRPSSTLLNKISPSTAPTTITSTTTTTPTAITTSLSALTTQLKGGKIANKLSEYLLISFTYSTDGEYLSLSWTTHPSLSNNTITPINECRLSAITDIVTKLSSLSSGYQIGGDKDDVYYPLDAPYANSQAIVPTERGNRALKLTLYEPCQRAKVFEELRLTSTTTSRSDSSVPVSDDRENNIVEPRSLSAKPIASVGLPGLPTPEAIDSSTATQQPTLVTTTNPVTTTSVISTANSSGSTIIPVESLTTTASPPVTSTSDAVQTATSATSTTPTAAPTNTLDQDSSDAKQPTRAQEATETSVIKLDTITSGAPATSTDSPPQLQQQAKVQPQAKSFASYLDTLEAKPDNTTMSSTTEAPKVVNISTLLTTTPPLSRDSSISVVPAQAANTTSESSLNEDFIGILNDVMEYLVSVAVPLAIIIGTILLISIIIAICSLCMKRRKSKQFEVRNRFNFRYGSERRAFLKNSSKPVILEADQKSLSMGGTPQHRPNRGSSSHNKGDKETSDRSNYLPMDVISSSTNAEQPPQRQTSNG